MGVPRVSTEHTTAEAIETMNDRGHESVAVVDRATSEVVAVLSRASLVRACVRGWHEPERCRLATHVRLRGRSIPPDTAPVTGE